MFGIFNKPYRGKPFDGSSILDSYINLDSIPQYKAIQFYFQIYKKMAEMLDVVFSGYIVGGRTFEPVDEYLDGMFDELGSILHRFDIRSEMDKLPITRLYGIHLNGNFVEDIKLWSKLKTDIFKDIEYLSQITTIHYPTPPDLELAFNRIDERLEEHKTKKYHLLYKAEDNILTWNNLILNQNKSTLSYKDFLSVNIQLNTQAIKLLKMLIKNGNNLTEYVVIAKELNLNSFHEGVGNKDIARDVQFVKKELNKILKKTGMSKEELGKMIISVRNTGFKLG